ncbi:SsgA family sporulation/cell division regulator [Streptomyces sp. NPDC059785]|uniref:SsgA family sporulation/cell division regulator n=1 Tax=unclassified Streptomyces TaxID=2593676 RepID=UPI003658A50C
MSVVEQYARAHLVTDSQDGERAVPVVLSYDPVADPARVRVCLPGPHRWTFTRDLLERGLLAPASAGRVSVWPCGRVRAVVEFHSAHGVAVVQFDATTLIRFLRSTYAATATTPATTPAPAAAPVRQ